METGVRRVVLKVIQRNYINRQRDISTDNSLYDPRKEVDSSYITLDRNEVTEFTGALCFHSRYVLIYYAAFSIHM